MVLVVMIDDATSKAMARFYPAETTEAYMDPLGRYLRKRGRMGSMYVDRDSIFRAEDHHPSDPRPTLAQFKRTDDAADPVRTQPQSVVSGLWTEDFAADGGA